MKYDCTLEKFSESTNLNGRKIFDTKTPKGEVMKPKKSTKFIGAGCAIQIIAVCFGLGGLSAAGMTSGPEAAWYLVVGVGMFVGLMVYGSRKSVIWHCPKCGTRLLNKGVLICAGCRSAFEEGE